MLDENLFKLSTKQRAYALFGTLLGDSTLTKRNRPFIKVSHTKPQKEYVLFLKELADLWNLRNTYCERTEQTTLGQFEYCNLNIWIPVSMQRHYVKFNRLFNDEGKKIVSKYAISRLNELGMLLLWLDDGNLQVYRDKKMGTHRYGRLHVNGFDEGSRRMLKRVLYERFGIDVQEQWVSTKKSIIPDKKYPIFKLGVEALYAWMEVVSAYVPYIPNSMLYKVNLDFQPFESKENLPALINKFNFHPTELGNRFAEAHNTLPPEEGEDMIHPCVKAQDAVVTREKAPIYTIV